MTTFICNTCGIEYEPSETPPVHCPVCEDERQYVPAGGQKWTTLAAMNTPHKNIVEKILGNPMKFLWYAFFCNRQRVHLLITPDGNILWDCIAHPPDKPWWM